MIFFVSSLGTHNFNKTQFTSSNIFSIPEYLCNTQHIDQKKIKLQTKTCDHRIAQARKKVHKSDITVVTSSDLDPVSLTREGPAWGILTVVTSSDLDPVSRTREEPAWGDLTLFSSLDPDPVSLTREEPLVSSLDLGPVLLARHEPGI